MDLYKTKSVQEKLEPNLTLLFRKRASLIGGFVLEIKHTVKVGETLDSIAYEYYKASGYWLMLMDINNVYNPFDIEAGLVLIIPNLNSIVYESNPT